jgi:PAS domain S-box-containing protein
LLTGAIIRVNAAFCEITGYVAPEVIGRNPLLLQAGRHDRAFYQALWTKLPFLNTTSVGIERMPKRAASACSSSVLTLARRAAEKRQPITGLT